MRTPPRAPGSYALLLALDTPVELTIGRLGMSHFPAGWYVYCGSAFGTGGLAARMQRHLAGNGALHWHVDYLRRAARLADWLWVEDQRLECAWSKKLVEKGGKVIVPGFGASDCREGCPAHLVYFESIEGWEIARQTCVSAS